MRYNRAEILFLNRIINKKKQNRTGNKAPAMIGLWAQKPILI